MSFLDASILILYMIGILIMGGMVGRDNKDDNDYFAGGQSMPWYALGLSVGLTMISANSFIGGPGWGYTSGIIAAMVNITVPLAIFFVTYTMLPVIYDAKVTTVYEYVNIRLGPKTRILNVFSWLAQSMIFVGGFVYTPALVLDAITGISMNIWIPVIVILAIIYTIAGGIKAVIWTDMIQGIILFLGIILSVFVASKNLQMPLSDANKIAQEFGLLKSFNSSFNLKDLNIWCAFFGGMALWMGYFGFDQGQVQRYITAKDMRTIKKTGIMSSFAMQLIYWLCFYFGIVLFVFYQNNPSTLDFGNANNIMTDFLLNYCPQGLLGILLAATFAAAMSSIDSVLNSLTTVFIKDIYEPYISKEKGTSLKKSMFFSGVFGVLIIAFVYLYLGNNTTSILATIADFVSPFGALLTGVMIVCCFIPSANDNGCFYGSILAVGVSLYISKSFEFHWLWAYFYGSVLCILFSWIASKFFNDSKNDERRYYYSLWGTLERVKGNVDKSGCSVEPLKIDTYGYAMVGILVIQCVILYMLQ